MNVQRNINPTTQQESSTMNHSIPHSNPTALRSFLGRTASLLLLVACIPFFSSCGKSEAGSVEAEATRPNAGAETVRSNSEGNFTVTLAGSTVPRSVSVVVNEFQVSCDRHLRTASVTEYYGSGGDVVLPSFITLKWTTGSGKDKIEHSVECYVTEVGKGVFKAFRGLTSVKFSSRLRIIGDSAFSFCSELTHLTIPNRVTSIGKDAFYKCTGLTSVTLGNSVDQIKERAFEGCTELKSVIFQGPPPSVYGWAFDRMSMPNTRGTYLPQYRAQWQKEIRDGIWEQGLIMQEAAAEGGDSRN